jgi:hypothetical protein
MAKNIAPVPAPGSAPAGAGKAVNASAAPSKNTTLVKKGHSKSVDPYVQPVANRTYAPKERGGAAYGIQVGFEAHVAPEAGMTQANGRVLQNAVNRSAPNFRTGMADHN